MLQRKTPPRVNKTVKKYPDIRKVIEDFACERRVGAESWQRTGLLTFSGKTKHCPKLTNRRIKAHLEKKIVSRKVRKGFNVKLNIDAKWSSSMYKILDYIQLRNGLDKVIINRDVAPGFWLDCTFTHKQHPILQDKSRLELATHTDFVNRYSRMLYK